MELEATPKRARASGGSSAAVGEPDRLSALPDCLLHTIMSFMKARQVVQTCVLSTRWKHLWRSVPCLDLDLDEFKTADNKSKYWNDFEDFAVNLMLCHKISLLDSFRLCLSEALGYFYNANKTAGGWVRRAMKYCTPDPGIQREGLSSNSWRLKRLHLCNVFLDSGFAEHISSACHSLEDLELKDCSCEFHAITSHTLKNLVLKNCSCTGLSDITSPTLKSLVIDGVSNRCLMVITAPALAYLRLRVTRHHYHFPYGISIDEMPSIDKASIHLWDYGGSAGESEFGHKQFKLLCSVSNVTHLELSDLGAMVLSEDFPAFKEFLKLRNLLLDNCDLSDDFQTLALFLQNSPNLEKLTLRRCKFSNDSKKKKGTPKPKKASSSQSQSLDVQCVKLKLTEIIYTNDDVRQLVELLLRISGKLPENQLKLTKVD